MRIAIVTESFLPNLNGVTTSVCRVLECLRDGGHEVVVIAPRPAPSSWAGYPVHAVASVPVRQFPVGLPTGEVEALLRRFAPDVVHVASPFVLGASALGAAARLGVPSVAVYQTDMPSYLGQHAPRALGRGAATAAWRWVRRVHDLADLTLAPSSAALAELEAHGIPRVRGWARGVDAATFRPEWRTDAGTRALRRSLAPSGEVLVGYVGRLAPEKELHRFASLAGLPGVRVVIVGDGPSRADDSALLGAAGLDVVLLGRREGDDLARAYAALDVFAHTGTRETFGQTLQEAAATSLPVVAPARGGPLDLVDHSRTGLLFDPDDPAALREAVAHLAGDRTKREAMGAAGRLRVEGRSWSALTDELVGHYESVRRAAVPAA
ncbi:glycosyl transferase [Phycicoccus sp. Root563]|uniref:glycosyltransferase family 4 protein n=1 Tax=Phycicoccus sp. Root563 TaxID=1736562 RepID=UPI00070280BB|nr:glycosyltransferase family 1 protein [Phycicoccus sp. Root563]KQZ90501.1 glycosyl transferase [Phycicoccus sp. Root563]